LGRTKTGRLWVYVRDDRPFCGTARPAAVYFYSPDRGGEHPATDLAGFNGFLQADGYAGFEALYESGPTGKVRGANAKITEVMGALSPTILRLLDRHEVRRRQRGARPDWRILSDRGPGPLRPTR
jgi:hypothetical protein